MLTDWRAMKIEIWIYSWAKYIAGSKHNYVKIFVDNRLVAEQGSVTDRFTFWTPKQAQNWADEYVAKHYPDEKITWKYLGDVKMRYQYSHEGD